MTAPPAGVSVVPPTGGVSVARSRLRVDEYLALYREIGEPLQWDMRLRMPREELAAFLAADTTLTFVLQDHRSTSAEEPHQLIGLCEFDCVGAPDIELTNFGIVPSQYGQRFGPTLLDGALQVAWSREPARIWLHTDTNDHPRALATYERAGFRVYKQALETFPD